MISSIHVIGAKKFGGAENFFVRLINALEQDAQPVIAVSPPDCELSPLISKTVNQKHFKMRNVYDLISRWQIQQLVRQSRFDIIQTYMGRATRLTQLSKNQPAVHIARLGGYYNLKGYRHAHAWIGNTRGICDYLIQNGFDSQQVFHIGNFVDQPEVIPAAELTRLRSNLSIPEQANIVLSVGRLHDNKGFDTLLNAFREILNRSQAPIYLIIVGDGPQKKNLLQLAEQLQLNDFIRWTGWQHNTAPYYALANTFICSSRHEPLGNVILEAWSHQLPVISTKTQGPLEFIENNQDALLTDIDDSQAIANSTLALFNNPDEQVQLAQSGYNKVQSQFGKQRILSDYLSVYQTLIQRRRSSKSK